MMHLITHFQHAKGELNRYLKRLGFVVFIILGISNQLFSQHTGSISTCEKTTLNALTVLTTAGIGGHINNGEWTGKGGLTITNSDGSVSDKDGSDDIISGFDASKSPYTVIWTHTNTSNTYEVTINVVDAPIVTAFEPIGGVTSVCSPYNAGFDLQITGGNSPYDIEFTSDAGYTAINDVPASYTRNNTPYSNLPNTFSLLSVVDDNGCAADLSGITDFTYVEGASTVLNVSGSPVPACAGTPLILSIVAGGGNTPGNGIDYVLQRDGVDIQTVTGDGSSTITFNSQTAAGTYGVVARGCGSDVPMNNTYEIESAPTVQTLSNPGSKCISSEIALDDSETGVRYYLYRDGIYIGSSTDGTGGAISFGTRTDAGEYTVVARNYPSGSCTTNMSGSLTIISPQIYTLSAVGGVTSYCAGADPTGISLQLSGSEPGNQYQLQYDNGAGGWTDIYSPQSSATGATLMWNNIKANTYQVEVTTPDGCTETMGNITIIESTLPTATIYIDPLDDSKCDNETSKTFPILVSLTGTTPFDIVIKDDKGNTVHTKSGIGSTFYKDFEVSPNETTTYYISSVTDGNGCTNNTGIGSATVTVKEAPSVIITGATEICDGTSTILSTSVTNAANETYQWSTTETADNITVSPTATTSYSVTVTSDNNCYDNATHTLTVNPLPTPTFNVLDKEYCEDDASFNLGGTPIGGTYYIDNDEDGVYDDYSITSFNPATYFTGADTDISIYYEVTDAKGCTGQSAVQTDITIYELPELTINNLDAQICLNGGSRTLYGSPFGGTWSVDGAGLIYDDTSGNLVLDLTNSTADTYNITYEYSDGHGCVNSITATTTLIDVVNIILEIDWDPSTPGIQDAASMLFCPTDDTDYPILGLINGKQLSNGDGITAGFTGDGIVNVDADLGTATFNPSDAGVGSHSIQFNINNGTCSSSVSETVEVGTEIASTLDLSYCQDASITETVQFTPGGSNVSLVIEDPDGETYDATLNLSDLNPVTDANQFSFSPGAWASITTAGTFGGPGTYTFTYSYDDGNGCVTEEEFEVQIGESVDASFTGLENNYCIYDDADALTPSDASVTISYSGAGIVASTFSPAIAGVGTHTITATATSGAGCTDTWSKDVTVVGVTNLDITNLEDAYCSDDAAVTIFASNAGDAGTYNFISTTGPAPTNANPLTYTAGEQSATFNPGADPNELGWTYYVTYEFTPVGAVGCKSSITKPVAIYENHSVNFSGLLLSEYCQGDDPFVITGDQGVGEFFIDGNLWGPGLTDLTGGDAEVDVSQLAVGNHTITYRYTRAYTEKDCYSEVSKSFDVIDGPVGVYQVTGGGAYCSGGTGVTITLDGSTVGVEYELLLDGNSMSPAVIKTGTGNKIDFINITDQGTYTVIARVTTSAACEKMMLNSVYVEAYDLHLGINSVTNVSCNGSVAPDGSVNLRASGGSGAYSYWISSTGVAGSWTENTNSVPNEFVDLSAGTYYFKIIDLGNGCDLVDDFNRILEITILEPNNPLAVIPSEIQKVGYNCDNNSGIGSIAIFGGTRFTDLATYPSGYQITWPASVTSVSSDSLTATGLSIGDYSVVVTDAQGCSENVVVTITEESELTLSYTSQVNNLCYGDDIATATVAASGGSGSYEFSIDADENWLTSSATPNYTTPTLTTGAHEIWVRDVNHPNCTASVNVNISGPASALALTVTPTGETCKGLDDGKAYLDISGGVGPYQYSLDGSTFVAVPSPTPEVTPIVPGPHTIIVRDANNCIISKSFGIDPATPITLSGVSMPASCNSNADGQVELTANPANVNYVYYIDGAGEQASNIFTGLAQGTYTFKVKDDVKGCESSDINVTVSEPRSYTTTHAKTDVICAGDANGSITLTTTYDIAPAAGSFEYSIDGGTTWHTSPLTGLSSGFYTVQVKDLSNDCVITYPTVIEIKEPTGGALSVKLDAASSKLALNCVDDTDGEIAVDLGTPNSGWGGYTFTWIRKGNNENFGSLQNLSSSATAEGKTVVSGTYELTVKDAGGCMVTFEETITQPDPWDASVDVTPNTIPNAATEISVVGNGTATLQPVSGGSASENYNYQWFDSGANSLASGVTSVSNLDPGNYYVEITDLTDGCTTTVNFTIIDSTVPLNANFVSFDQVCSSQEGKIEISILSGTPDFTIKYKRDSDPQVETTISGTSYIISGNPGTYDIEVSDAAGGIITSTKTINPVDPIEFNNPLVDYVSNCAVDISVDVVVPDDNYTGVWTVPVGASSIINQSFTAAGNPNVVSQNNLTVPGDYILTLYHSSENACNESYTFTVPDPTITVSEDLTNHNNVSCNGGVDGYLSVDVTGRDASHVFNYVWQNTTIDPTGINKIDTGSKSTLGDTEDVKAGEWIVTVTTSDGFCSETISLQEVTEPDAFTIVSYSVTDVESCSIDNSGKIQVEIAGGTMPYEVSLYNGTTTTTQTLSSTFFVFDNLLPGDYTVTAKDANNCGLASESISIKAPASVAVTNFEGVIDCNGSADGKITFDISGGYRNSDNESSFAIIIQGDNGFSYSEVLDLDWDSDSEPYSYSFDNATGLEPATYTVQVWDAKSSAGVNVICPVPAFEQSVSLEYIDISGDITNVSCSGGDNDGAISNVTITGTSGNYTFDWTTTASIDNLDHTALDQRGLAPGTYTLSINDIDRGCPAFKEFEVEDGHLLVISSYTTHNVSCFNGNDGTIELTATPAGGNYVYSIDNGISWQTSNLFEKLVADSYDAIVKDLDYNCESAIKNIIIEQPSDITIAAATSINHVTCFGDEDGSFIVSASDVEGSLLQYAIETDASGNPIYQDSPLFTGLSSGTYALWVRRLGTECEVYQVDYVTITEPTNGQLTVTVADKTDISCVDNADGIIDITASGGWGSYNYSWRNVETNNSITFDANGDVSSLQAGTYEVVVQDAEGCSVSLQETITKPDDWSVHVNTTDNSIPNTPLATGNGTASLDPVSGGSISGNYLYDWYDDFNGAGTLVVANQTTTALANLNPGNYSVKVSVLSTGCEKIVNFTIGDSSIPLAIAIDPSNAMCNGTYGSLQVTMVSGTAPYTITIQRASDHPVSISTSSSTYLFENLIPGNYTIKVVDALTGIVNETALITEPDVFTAAGTVSYSNCAADIDVTVSPAGDYNISWEVPLGATAITSEDIDNTATSFSTVTVTASGDYIYTVTNTTTGCTYSETLTVDEPSITITEDLNQHKDVTCFGGDDAYIRVNVSGREPGHLFTYEWSNDNGLTYDPALSTGTTPSIGSSHAVTAGKWSVRVTSLTDGCQQELKDIVVEQPNELLINNVDITHITTCSSDTLGSVEITVTGGTYPYSVQMSNGVVSRSEIGSKTVFIFTGLPSGDNYNLTVTDANNCSTVSQLVTIESPDPIAVDMEGAVSCNGAINGVITLDISGGVEDASGNNDYDVVIYGTNGFYKSFTVNSTQIPYSTEADFGYLNEGNYTVEVRDALASPDLYGVCPDPAYTGTVTLSQIHISGLVKNKTCPGGSNNGEIFDVLISGGSGDYSWKWTYPDGYEVTGTGEVASIYNLDIGEYTIEVTDNESGCTVSSEAGDYVVGYDRELLIVDYNLKDVSCNGYTDGFIKDIETNASDPSSLTYSWVGVESATVNDIEQLDLEAGYYKLTIVDADGCRAVLEEIIDEPKQLTFNLNNQLTCNPFNQRIYVTDLDGGNGDHYTYQWEDPDGNLLPDTGNEINVTQKGNYRLTVTDEEGLCSLSRIITVSGEIIISTVRVEDITCNGGLGLIEISASGGNADNLFTYNWQQETAAGVWTDVDALASALVNGNTVLNNAQAGVYRVQVTNVTDNCVTTSTTYELSEQDELTYINVIPKHIDRCNGDFTGELEIRVTGGTGIYYLDYNEDGVTDFTSTDGTFLVSGLAAGDYQLRVVDSNGCATNPALYPVEIEQPDPLLLNINTTTTKIDCETPGTGVIEFSITGGNMDSAGNPFYKVSVTGQADQDVYTEGQTLTYSDLDAGTYTIYVQDMLASDPASCTIVRDEVVLSHIVIEGEEIPNICAVTSQNVGAIRNISITGTSDDWEWEWDEVNGDPVSDNTQLNQENLPVGEYVLVVTDNKRGCTVPKTFVIGESTQLNITGVAVPISCYGAGDGKISGVTITGTTNYNYTWTGPGTLDQSRIDGQDNLKAGTYELYVEDIDNGCQVTKSFEITEPTEITFGLEKVIESCSPYRRGINITGLTGGSGSYNFRWTGPGGEVTNTRNLTGLTVGGLYEVTVNDYSCNIIKSVYIEKEVNITTEVTDIKCNGDATGIIAVPEITGGSGNFSYVWTKDGAVYKSGTDISDIDISGLTEGTYELTITDNEISDGSACTYSITETLKAPDLLVVTGDVTHITCNGAKNGTINIQVAGGSEPYTYKWSTVDGSGYNEIAQNQIGLSGGTYTVQVTDAKGCLSAETSFTVNEVDAIDFDLNRTDTNCDGTAGAVRIENLSGGSGTYQNWWSTDDGVGIVQGNVNQTALEGGTYIVKVWDEDYPTCFLEKEVTLTKAITIIPTVKNQTCNTVANGQIDIAVTGGIAPYTYEWTPAVGIDDVNTAGQSNLEAGNYTLKVTDSRPAIDGGPCSVTTTITVGIDFDLQFEYNVNEVSCNGGNNGVINITKITGGLAGNYSYSWSGLPSGNDTNSQNQSGLPAGDYTVVITDDDSGCSISQTISVEEPVNPVQITDINIGHVDCKGEATGTIAVTVEGGTPFKDNSGNDYYKYQWVGSGVGLVQDSPNQTNLTAGTYTVMVIDSLGNTGGCMAYSGDIVISEPLAAISATVTGIQNVSAQGGKDGEIEIFASGGTGSLHYKWSGVEHDGLTPITVSHIGSNPTELIAGVYEVIITDDNGCSLTLEDIIVTEPDLPLTMSVNTQDIKPCNGDANGAIQVDAFGGQAPYTITLLQGATTIRQVSSHQLKEEGLSKGNYIVQIEDDNGTVIIKNDVEINEPDVLELSASVTNHSSCYNGSNGSISYTISGGTSNYYVLVTGPGLYRNESSGLSAGTYSLNGLAAGEYRILLIDDNSGNGSFMLNENCYKEEFITITQPEAVVTVSDDSEICLGESANIRFSVSNYSGSYPLTVDLSDGKSVSLASANQLYSVSPLVDTEYTIVNVYDAAGNCLQGTGTGSAVVTVHAIPSAHIELIGDNQLCFGEETQFNIHFEGVAPYNVTYFDGVVQTQLTNILTKDTLINVIPQVGTTNYTITSISDVNCVGTYSGTATVTVNELPTVTMDIDPEYAVICAGDASEIIFDFPSGKGDYEVSFTENGVLRSVNAVPLEVDGKYLLSVNPVVTTTYKLVSVKDGNNCDVTITEDNEIVIEVKQAPGNAGLIYGNTVVCQGEQMVEYAVDSIPYAENYLWSVPASVGSIVSQTDTLIIINFNADFVNGSISVRGSNTCGEGAPFNLAITANPLPDKPEQPNGLTSICAGSENISYSISEADHAISYIWLLPEGFEFASNNQSGSTILVNLVDGYTDFTGDIRVIAVNDCGQSLESEPLTVIINPIPKPDAGANEDGICLSTHILNAVDPGAGFTGVWTLDREVGTGLIVPGNENNANAEIYNLSHGDNGFIWTVTSDAGCSYSDTVVITNDQFDVDVSANSETVCDGSVELTGSPIPEGAVGSWEISSGSGNILVDPSNNANALINGLGLDNNTIVWSVSKNNCVSSVSIDIENNQTTTATIADENDVLITEVNICGSKTIVLKGSVPTPDEKGFWQVKSGSVVIDNINNPVISVSNIDYGDHELVWNILKGSCNSQASVIIKNNALEVDAGKDRYSCDGTTMLNGTEVPSDATGQWTVIQGSGYFVDGGDQASTVVTGLDQSTPDGINIFRWTLTRNGCESYDEVIVYNDQPSPAEIAGGNSSISICDYEYMLHAVTPQYGTGVWSVVGGQGKFDNPADANTRVYDLANGENIFRWTVSNNTCSSSVDFKITNLHIETYAGADTAVCGRTAKLNATPAPDGATGQWTLVSGSAGVVFNPANTQADAYATSLGYGSNSLVWTVTKDGCVSRDTVVVSNNAPYEVNASTYIYTDGNSTTLRAEIPEAGTGVWTLVEGRGDIANPNSATTDVSNLLPNYNYFRWTVSNANCFESIDVAVQSGTLADADAGLNQLHLCDDYTTLSANEPEGTYGEWTIVEGSADFESYNSATTNITNIRSGQNVFRWTLRFAGGSDNFTTDTVIIVNNKPTDADAGLDIYECGDVTTLNAREPVVGSSSWSVLSGGGIFEDDTNAKSVVTDLAKGENVFKYQIQQDICFSYDTISVFNYEPSDAYAGDSLQVVCADSTLLNPEIPKYGEGTWRVIQGAGKGRDSDGNETDEIDGYVYDLAPGINKLVWEVKVPEASSDCIKRDTVTIINNQPSESFAGHDRPVCADTVVLSGSVPVYGVGTWTLMSGSGTIVDSSQTNTLVRNLAVGKNRFRWTIDNNGCTSYSDVEISNDYIQAFAGYDQPTNCADTAVLEANNPLPGIGTWGIEGGSGSANFDDNEDPYSIVRNLDKGENILTWTINYKQCRSVSRVSITNNEPSEAIAGDNKATCEDSFVLGAAHPEVGTGFWSIKTGGGDFEDEFDNSTKVNNLKFGANIFRWTVENNGCTLYDDVQISFNRIDAEVGGIQEICADHTFLEANNAAPGLGTWSVIGGSSQARFADTHDATTEVLDLAKGSNVLRWTINNEGCITSAEVEVINHTPSTAYAGGLQEICEDSTVLDATAVEIGTGEWEVLIGGGNISADQVNNPNANITGLSKGENVLRWTVTSDNGLCSSTDDVTITNNEPSEPYAGASDEYCSPTVQLKAAVPDFGTGLWSIIEGGGNFDDPLLSDATISNLNEGVNILRWTISEGQCHKSSDIELLNNTPTIANAGPDIEDCKNYAELDANLPTQGEGFWTLISGNADFIDETDAKTRVEGLTFGENILMWNVQKGNCVSTDQMTVFNQIPDQAEAGTNRSTCEDYLTLNANNPDTGLGTWTIISGNGEFDDINSPTTVVRNLGLGENRFKWIVAYGECTTEDEVEIISNKADPYAGEDAVVYDPEFELKASNPGDLGATWSVIAGTGDFDDDTYFNTTVRNLTEGYNTFRWLMNVNNCITYDDVSIEYRVVPDAAFIVDTTQGCYPLTIEFTNYSDGGTEFLWDFGDGYSSSDRNPIHTFSDPGDYTVTLTAPGPDGVNGVYTKNITVFDHPVAEFSYTPDVVYVPGKSLSCSSLSLNAVYYLWDFGDGITSNEVNPFHEYTDAGVYDLSLTVESQYGCTDQIIKTNAVTAVLEGFITFPTAFTPRPDGGTAVAIGGGESNEVFRPVYRDVDQYQLQIFNRWGQLIYESTDIEEGWNGFYNNELSPQGVYVWKVHGNFISGKVFTEAGSVLLVR